MIDSFEQEDLPAPSTVLRGRLVMSRLCLLLTVLLGACQCLTTEPETAAPVSTRVVAKFRWGERQCSLVEVVSIREGISSRLGRFIDCGSGIATLHFCEPVKSVGQ